MRSAILLALALACGSRRAVAPTQEDPPDAAPAAASVVTALAISPDGRTLALPFGEAIELVPVGAETGPVGAIPSGYRPLALDPDAKPRVVTWAKGADVYVTRGAETFYAHRVTEKLAPKAVIDVSRDLLYISYCEGATPTCGWLPARTHAPEPDMMSVLELRLPRISDDGKTLAVESVAGPVHRVELIPVGGTSGEAIPFRADGDASEAWDVDAIHSIEDRLRTFQDLPHVEWTSGDEVTLRGLVLRRSPTGVTILAGATKIGEATAPNARTALLVDDGLAYVRGDGGWQPARLATHISPEDHEFAAISADGKTLALRNGGDDVELIPVGATSGEKLPMANLDAIEARLAGYRRLPTGGDIAITDVVWHAGKSADVYLMMNDRRFSAHQDLTGELRDGLMVSVGEVIYVGSNVGWLIAHPSGPEPELKLFPVDLPAISADGKTLALDAEAQDEDLGTLHVELVPAGASDGEDLVYEERATPGLGHDVTTLHDDKIDAIVSRLTKDAFKTVAANELTAGDDLTVGKLVFHVDRPEDRKSFDVMVKMGGKLVGEARKASPAQLHPEAVVVVSDSLVYVRYGEGLEYLAQHWLAIPLKL
jgi:hypothetical protein